MSFARDIFTRPWHTIGSLFRVTSSSAVATSESSAFVSWTLSEPGTGQTEYGSTVAYGSTTTLASVPRLDHQQNISGLTAGQTYHARGHSVSAAGVDAYTDDMTFTTSGSSVTTSGPRPGLTVPTGPAVKVIGTDTVAVDDSGNTDVTSVLNNIIANLNAGDTLVFAQGDTTGYVHGTDTPISHYLISGSLNVNVPNGVTLFGYGTRITRVGNSGGNDAASMVVNRAGMLDLTIAGFELYGANSAYSRTITMFSGLSGEGQSGIQFRQWHQGSVIEDCWIHHHNGDGIQQVGWTWSFPLYNVGDVTVRYCRVEDSSRMGINPNVGRAINNPYGWDIHHNIIEHQAGRNINAEDVREISYPPAPWLSMHIWENDFGPTGWQGQGTSSIPNNYFGVMSHIILMTNTATQDWGQLGPFYIHDNRVSGLMPEGTLLPGTRLFFDTIASYAASAITQSFPIAGGVRIEDNTFDLSPWPQPSTASISAVRFAKATGAIVRNNDFQGFLRSGDWATGHLNTGIIDTGNT